MEQLPALSRPFQIIFNKLKSKAVKHQNINDEMWIQYAEQMRTIPKDTVCHLAHYATDDGRNVFVLSDVAKVIPTTTVAAAANLDNVKATWFKTAGNASTIFNLIQCADPSPANVAIILCSTMEEKNVIIRLAADTSLRLAFKDLKRELGLLSAVIQTTLSSDVDTNIVANSFNVTPDVREFTNLPLKTRSP